MNKTILIAGGVGVASLAVGGVSGYFLAKKKFDAALDDQIAQETEAVKKYYRGIVASLRTTIEEMSTEEHQKIVEETPEEETEDDVPIDPEVEAAGRRALVNYQGFAKPSLDAVVSNIFDKDSTARKPRPPRDPESGRFTKAAPETTETRDENGVEQTPYIITHEQFLENELDFDQENLKYFLKDQTLIQVYDNETVDIARVGEVNLTLFPQVPRDEPSIICVRNEGLQIDYEIQLTHESLTAYMGLGEDDEDLDDEYAGQG